MRPSLNPCVNAAGAVSGRLPAPGLERLAAGLDYSLRARHGAQTVIVYRRRYAQFASHVAHLHAEVTGPEQVTRRHVESWLASLAEAGRGPATRRVRLMTLKTFFGWMAEERGAVPAANPTTGVRAPEVPLPPVPVIHDDDLRSVRADWQLELCNAARSADEFYRDAIRGPGVTRPRHCARRTAACEQLYRGRGTRWLTCPGRTSRRNLWIRGAPV